MALKKKAAPTAKKAAKKPTPAKEPEVEKAPKVEPVPLDDVKMGARDRDNLVSLCEDYIASAEIISTHEKFRKETAAKIKEETKRLKLPPAVFTDTFKLTVSKGERKTLQPTVLLSLGVSNAIIEKATKRTPTETIRVTAAGEDGGEGGGE